MVEGRIIFKTERQGVAQADNEELRKYKEYVSTQLGKVVPVLQKVAMGDFSQRIDVPEEEEEFTEIFVALNLMIDDIQAAEVEKKEYAERRLAKITPVLQKAAMADFSEEIKIPKEEDEFTELLVGLNLMLDDIKELMDSREASIVRSADATSKMIEAVTKVARGDYSAKVEVSGKNDDLDSLAMGINTMVDDIRRDSILQKKNEEAIETERKKLESYIESIADGILILDTKGKIVDVNRAFVGMFGREKNEIVGKPAFATGVLAKKNIPKALLLLKEIIRQGSVENKEMELLTKDKKEIPTLVSASLVKDSRGKPVNVTVSFKDITERKKVEWSLKERIKELNAIYTLSRIVETHNVSLGDLCRELAELIPPAFQYPESTCAKVSLGHYEYRTKNFKETKWKLSADIIVSGKKKGSIEVYHLEEKPAFDERPFLTEEETLIKNLGKDVVNIIGRKDAEEALKMSEARFRAMTESTSDWIWEVDQNGVYIYASPMIKDLLGYEPNEVLGKTPFDFMLPEEVKRVAAEFENIIKVRRAFEGLENGNLHKNGQIVVLETSGVPVFDEKGDFHGYRGIDRDITARKKVEEEIRTLSSAVSQSVDGIAIYSFDGKLVYVNDAFAKMHSYTLKEMIGLKTEKIHVSGQLKHLQEGLHQVKEAGSWSDDHDHLRKDGTPFPTRNSDTLLKDEKGKPTGILVICRDVTQMKETQEVVRRLQELDKSKDDFLNISAHELKTPLTSIVGLSKIMAEQKTGLSSEQRRYVDIIHEEGVRLNHVTKRILTITRFESGRETVHLEPINLSEFVPSMLPALEILIRSKNLKLTTNIEEKDVVINSDREKISEVVYNFVDNATKYGDEGQTITISASKPVAGWVKIAVSDQGQGIAPALQKNLFKKFSQLEPSLSRSQEGTGLGLYICKLITDKLGGQIGVKSTLGEGSTFYLALPLQETPE